MSHSITLKPAAFFYFYFSGNGCRQPEPMSWPLTDNPSRSYLEEFFAVNTIKNIDSGEIVGWEYEGNYISFDPQDMVATGHGGWAAGRRSQGDRGSRNVGLWFIDEQKGGQTYDGTESFHMNTVYLTNDDITVEVFRPDQVTYFENGTHPTPVHRYK